jgi:hypothetical protein
MEQRQAPRKGAKELSTSRSPAAAGAATAWPAGARHTRLYDYAHQSGVKGDPVTVPAGVTQVERRVHGGLELVSQTQGQRTRHGGIARHKPRLGSAKPPPVPATLRQRVYDMPHPVLRPGQRSDLSEVAESCETRLD